MKKLNAVARFSVACVAICCLAITAAAQIQNGQLTGLVTDPTGASIPNATVKATHSGTGATTAAQTGDAGIYTLRELPAATYKVTVEAAGFKTTSTNAEINAGTTLRADFKLQVGQASEIVEVTDVSPPVNTEDSKLATIISAAEIQNLPLNGRNVYDLIQTSPGAVNTQGVVSEGGNSTVINGIRSNFNGFLINGSSNKGLSGDFVTQPILDSVQEFQQLSLNMSAQYGNSAGSIANLVTKSGTNAYHGSAWWFVRNDVFDANQFFINQAGAEKPAVRFNQFGGTFGGPIIKDKLFFFASAQGERFRSSVPPATTQVESAGFRSAACSLFPSSVACLMYTNFAPDTTGAQTHTLAEYVAADFSGSGFTTFNEYLCPSEGRYAGDPGGAQRIPTLFAQLFGYTAATDDVGCANPLSGFGVADQAGIFSRTAPFLFDSIALSGSQERDNLFHGYEWSGRVDYNFSDNDRLYGQFNWVSATDMFGPQAANLSTARGAGAFSNPTKGRFPNAQASWVHTFSPTFLNEARVGYAGNLGTDIDVSIPGVPQLSFGDGTAGFGSYNGYPQIFHEHIYTYADMVSISKGKHNLKIGVDVRRNLEHSEFNVARSSYYFFDPLFFAVDAPYVQTNGVNPHLDTDPTGASAELASSFRHWRNWEIGAFFQDDWKISKNLTLNLGIRYDLFMRHQELNDLETTFIKGPGTFPVDNITTGAGFIGDANVPAGTVGVCDSVVQIASATLAGVCGPGGFSPADSLGAGDHNNFGPRVGFAWDVFGDGKTSIRGGFGISYEGTLYNPLSNSRWNLPYYSFDSVSNYLDEDVNTVLVGPITGPGFTTSCPNCATAPTFTGAPSNPGQGTGAQGTGNLYSWDASNPHLALFTGIIFPEGIKDPYVMNYFLSLQRELVPKLVLEVNYVGTGGRKLFRSEDINRIPGGRLPVGVQVVDNFGRTITGRRGGLNSTGRLNPNYGRLREWQNVVNSSYNALQVSLKKLMSRGFSFEANYTWSHSLDAGSTWHSGSTTANGGAGGDGLTTDQTIPALDRSNSIFDIRHRFVVSSLWELPFFKNAGGAAEAVLGGWQINGVMSAQTGPHWSPFRSSSSLLENALGLACTQADVNAGTCFNIGGDYNLDAVPNDRPNSTLSSFGDASHDMWANGFGGGFVSSVFSDPCLGCAGNLGRNTFVGPGQWATDLSILKNFKLGERAKLQFRAEFFNILNHTNFLLDPAAAGTGHNKITDPNFGQAGGTLNARNIQFGLRLSF